ncbi:MAG: hypothetical protein ACFFC3_12720 [Candidatus Odinarchaeota archaeon]
MSNIKKTNKIQVICPICKTRDLVGIPRSQLNKKSQLTTISIQKGLICPHHFQFFLDNQFQIRGYQKVDLELNHENSKKLSNGVKALSQYELESDDLFEKIIYDGDNTEFIPLNSDKNNENNITENNANINNRKMTLKEIYEEFRELIDEENKFFQQFIIKDNKRKKCSTFSNTTNHHNQIELDQEV